MLTGRLPRLGRLAGLGAAAFGPPLATYTAALLANTAVPAWHEAHRELPFVFAGSGASAAGGMALLLTPVQHSRPGPPDGDRRSRRSSSTASELLKRRLGMVAEPYRAGPPGSADAARVADDRWARPSSRALGGRSRAVLGALRGDVRRRRR